MTTREQQIAELQRIARATAEEERVTGLPRIMRENERASITGRIPNPGIRIGVPVGANN